MPAKGKQRLPAGSQRPFLISLNQVSGILPGDQGRPFAGWARSHKVRLYKSRSAPTGYFLTCFIMRRLRLICRSVSWVLRPS